MKALLLTIREKNIPIPYPFRNININSIENNPIKVCQRYYASMNKLKSKFIQ